MTECAWWQKRYKAPKGSKAANIDEGEGKGNFCLDKHIDEKSVDKINLNKKLIVTGLCDGFHPTGHPQGGQKRGRGQLALTYVGKNKKELHIKLKPLCKTSDVNIHNYNPKYNLDSKMGIGTESKIDLCQNKTIKYSLRTKQDELRIKKLDPDYYKIEKKKKPETKVFIEGKVKNSKNWWENLVSTLDEI
jgi:hypothetical protein